MENNWEPRVGQKVVCLVDMECGLLKKGDVVSVNKKKKCACGRWMAETGDILPFDIHECSSCSIVLGSKGDLIFWDTCIFAPLPEQYADMTSEIAQQFKEHPDTVDQPVKVLEVQN